MSNLSQLQERVTAIEELFKASKDVIRRRSEQLAALTGTIEESVVGSQELIQSLREELARAQEDHQQLRAMLDSLLAAAGAASVSQCEMEARLSHLIETASTIGVGQNPQQSDSETGEKTPSELEALANEQEEPLELTQMILDDGSVADVKMKEASPAKWQSVVKDIRRSNTKRDRG